MRYLQRSIGALLLGVGIVQFPCVSMASVESKSANGINSIAVPYTGSDIAVGQVEPERSSDPDLDNGANSNFFTNPADVFLLDGRIAPTANAAGEIIHATLGPHATEVAGVVISKDVFAPGIAEDADLYSSGSTFRVTTPQINASYVDELTAKHVATRNGGDVRAINMSYLVPFDAGGVPNGNSQFTQFVDWSASTHDTLYVVAGRETVNGIPLPASTGQPADNFNGMTVGASSKANGVYRQVASFNDFSSNTVGDRTAIDIIAPGEDIKVPALGGGAAPIVDGTSFAAPHVVGTVALIQEHAELQITNSVPNWGANARRHEVNKAVIMNSADKLIDNGTLSFDGNVIQQGQLLGMERTVVQQDGTSTWLDSDAFDNFPSGSGQLYEGGLFPLDIQMGTGHLNAKRALQQFNPGEHEADSGNVPLIGWDYGSLTGTGDRNRYPLNAPLNAGDFISITLAWDREVNFETDGGVIGDFDEGDTFEDYTNVDPILDTIADDVISDLDLYLLPAGAATTSQAVALSVGIDSTVEHIFFPIPSTGSYEIWVEQFDDDAGAQDYGLAWWTGLAPDIPVANPNGDFDGDGDVDGDDLSQWQGDYGLNADSDADNDGDSDGNDFLAWQRNYTGPGTFAASTVIPEPSSLLLFVLGLQLLLRRQLS